MSNVVLGVRVNPAQYQRIKIENVDLEGKVESLRENASQKINRAKQELELIYAGVILEDSSTLSSYGIKHGVTVHVLEKRVPPNTKAAKSINEPEVKKLMTALEEYRYKNTLLKLARPEVMEKIIADTPSLVEDPAAIALLQDPELVVLLAEPDTLRRALEVHPVLIDALSNIVTYMKENANTVGANVPSTSTGYSYYVDALSDDDDMESSESSREPNALSRNASFNAITAAQLAAAIANATTNFSSTGAIINPPTQNSGSNSLITTEMFGNALQQAFASSPAITNAGPPTFPTPNAASRNGGETLESIRTRLQPQLQQMKEMGLTNESQNVRALQATSGDVQAAIELVFNGVID